MEYSVFLREKVYLLYFLFLIFSLRAGEIFIFIFIGTFLFFSSSSETEFI